MNWRAPHLVAMYTATLMVKPKVIVELGTGLGKATEMFSDALEILRQGTVYTIDKYPDNPQVIKAKKRLQNRKNIVFVAGDSVEVGKLRP